MRLSVATESFLISVKAAQLADYFFKLLADFNTCNRRPEPCVIRVAASRGLAGRP